MRQTCSSCRAAQRLELKGVQAYSNVESLQALHTLPTAIVDYRGVRLLAQGLAPGLEGSEQDQEAAAVSRYTSWSHCTTFYCGRGVNAVKPDILV